MAGARGVLFSGDDAEAVAARLRADGWEVDVRRERLAGEDDDEDHPWAVTTDAPDVVLELLVDERDGWLDHQDPAGGPAPGAVPLELPVRPRRLKRES